MHEFGADRRLLLLKALHDAAVRSVKLRILTAKESISSDNSTGKSNLPEEVKKLVDVPEASASALLERYRLI
uniref:Uncharacterized protein n=1 Tax=Globisporangium ultimum (strain ATCC 200006 / CBS 805.95 / DAOM BR144) TaxID=431595 RepID=K3WDZ3_GLOUD